MLRRILSNKKAFSRHGILNVVNYFLKTKVLNRYYAKHKRADYQIGTLKSKGLMFPLYFRYNSSDINVFSQIYIQDEYGPIDPPAADVKFIIDCGANVGYSSAYFLSKYPHCSVFAIEPDIANFEILKRNLEPYGPRAQAMCSAVWSHKTGLRVNYARVGDGKEWATTVSETADGEVADLEAIDIENVLFMMNQDKVDILKMDIEGAESEVFSRNYEKWLPKVDLIAIELHGKYCRETFSKALSWRDYDFSRSGELTIAIPRDEG